MTKMFVFHGVFPDSKGDLNATFLKQGHNINEAVKGLLEGYEDWKYPEETIHYGVAYEADHIPDHLNLMKMRGKEWGETFHELIRLIKQGAVPFSYMLIEGKWYRADQSLLKQGLTTNHVLGIMEQIRVLKGAIVMDHDAKRFKGDISILTDDRLPDGSIPGSDPDYFRVPRDSEGTPIPNPGEEMGQLVSSFLQSVGAEPKVDHMAAVRDIAKRFS